MARVEFKAGDEFPINEEAIVQVAARVVTTINDLEWGHESVAAITLAALMYRAQLEMASDGQLDAQELNKIAEVGAALGIDIFKRMTPLGFSDNETGTVVHTVERDEHGGS